MTQKKNTSASARSKKEILVNRAKRLAGTIGVQEEDSRGSLKVLEFKLAKESYAIELQYIQEVYRIKDFTPLPTVPSFVFGLINVRRKILSVIDLHVLFDIPRKEEAIGKKVIILKKNDIEFAFLTDDIIGVEIIQLNAIQPVLPTLTGIQQELLKGITVKGLAILDGEKFLSDSRIIVDETI